MFVFLLPAQEGNWDLIEAWMSWISIAVSELHGSGATAQTPSCSASTARELGWLVNRSVRIYRGHRLRHVSRRDPGGRQTMAARLWTAAAMRRYITARNSAPKFESSLIFL